MVAEVNFSFDGVSTLVVILLLLLYEDWGSFKHNCTWKCSWEIRLLDKEASSLQDIMTYIMSAVLSALSIDVGIFTIPPVMFEMLYQLSFQYS